MPAAVFKICIYDHLDHDDHRPCWLWWPCSSCDIRGRHILGQSEKVWFWMTSPRLKLHFFFLVWEIIGFVKGIARTQSPTIKNYALELPTFGVIVGVSLTGVQWRGLTLEEPPSWSWLTSAPGKYAEGSYHFWLDESEFRGLIDANCKLCQRKKTLLKILVLFSTKHAVLILSTIVLYKARTTPSDRSRLAI